MEQLSFGNEQCRRCPYIVNLSNLQRDITESKDTINELIAEDGWENTLMNANFAQHSIYIPASDPLIVQEVCEFKASLQTEIKKFEEHEITLQETCDTLTRDCNGPLELGAVTRAGQAVVATVCQSPNTIASPDNIELVRVERMSSSFTND